ncbi:MAG: hypothetical protein DRH17_05995 [Deltaproteobacteria bacterium]|nr:MAG: hypothetical protein DRH17_05995 [Deltaproteobacteria bacterium]
MMVLLLFLFLMLAVFCRKPQNKKTPVGLRRRGLKFSDVVFNLHCSLRRKAIRSHTYYHYNDSKAEG